MNIFKINIIVLIITTLIMTGHSSNHNEFKLYRLDNATWESVNTIEKEGGSISRFFPNNFAEVYLNQNQFDELVKKGYSLYQITDKDKLYADSLYEATKNTLNPMANYHTYQEITDTLQIWSQQYSSIAELHTIGQTVLGREMWVMKISDNVNIEEAEPEFKYISTMHGDEVVGKELMLELIRLLLSDYGIDQRITNLVNNTEIWIMPNMNFDGTELHRRYNANWVDLNRNFPDREYGNPPYLGHPYTIQPETQNIINFVAQHNFVLSANFHGGALVANYPWDKRLPGDGGIAPYAGAPDDSTFIDLALTYAERNLPMYNSSSFTNGITNGADWYEIDGGLQDWNYFEFDCKELIIEVSNVKWPSATQLPQFWLDNKESLLAYMEKIHTGIKGIVAGSLTGLPVAAYITVLETGTGVSTDPDFGDYYKVISPGIYNVLVSAQGYRDSLITNVQVDSFPATVIDVRLKPDFSYSVSGLITDIESGLPINGAEVSFINKGTVVRTDTTISDGTFLSSISPDTFEIKVFKSNYFTIYDTVIISSDTSLIFEMQKIYPAMVKGTVTSTIGSSLFGAVVYCDGVIDTLDNSGYFRLNGITPGDISVFAYLFNHKIVRLDTVVNNGDSLLLSFELDQGSNEIFDDFESISPIVYSPSGDWQLGSLASGPMNAHSGANVWATNLNGNYSNSNLLSSLETSEIAIMGFVQPKLKFYHWYDFEFEKDGGNVKISIDGGANWQVIHPMESYPVFALAAGTGNPMAGESAFSGEQLFWDETTFDLSAYSAFPAIKIRFDVGVDNITNLPGWYIDDLQIFDGNVVKVENPRSAGKNLLPSINNFPNPFNPVTKIRVSLPMNSFIDLRIYDVRGSLVKVITSKEYMTGDYEFLWDGTNISNKKVASGIYFMKLFSDEFTLNRKLLLIR